MYRMEVNLVTLETVRSLIDACWLKNNFEFFDAVWESVFLVLDMIFRILLYFSKSKVSMKCSTVRLLVSEILVSILGPGFCYPD
jgi:hypothetical protein